jgi:hypothetical protein
MSSSFFDSFIVLLICFCFCHLSVKYFDRMVLLKGMLKKYKVLFHGIHVFFTCVLCCLYVHVLDIYFCRVTCCYRVTGYCIGLGTVLCKKSVNSVHNRLHEYINYSLNTKLSINKVFWMRFVLCNVPVFLSYNGYCFRTMRFLLANKPKQNSLTFIVFLSRNTKLKFVK